MREKKSSSATSLQSSVFFWRLASFLLSAWLLLTFYSWHILNSTHHANPLPATSVLDAATATDHVHTQSEVTSKAPPLKVEGAGKEDKHVLPSLEELATYANTNIKWKDCSTDGACMEQVLPQQKGDAVYSTSQMRVLHVLCPYPSSHEDVMQSQKMVMASIATAQHYWKQYGSHKSAMDVDVVAIEQWIHRDQRVAVPTAFYRSPYFLRLTAQDFLPETVNISKSLPILREILEIAYMLASRGDYTHVVFSNMDIAVMPFLYEDVHSMLACSSNFFINR